MCGHEVGEEADAISHDPPFSFSQVPRPEEQHRVMQEAVENHMPQAIIIDEIGTEAECQAARTIAQRGLRVE